MAQRVKLHGVAGVVFRGCIGVDKCDKCDKNPEGLAHYGGCLDDQILQCGHDFHVEHLVLDEAVACLTLLGRIQYNALAAA
jgi:hypothetical protein